MRFLLLQVAAGGVPNIDPNWVILTLLGVIGTLASVIAFMYRAESKRKDELITRLLRQANRTADVTDRTVTLAEKQMRGTGR